MGASPIRLSQPPPPPRNTSVSAEAHPIIPFDNRQSMRAFFIAVLFALVCASPAAAHPSPFSYIDVRIPGAAVDVTVAAHIFDVAHDLGVADETVLLDPAAVAARREAIIALL